ncbi:MULTISPECIES: S4 domain-containing protein YaaA [Ureibacillus]|uniref:Ribosome-associated protein n=1 Tax=Ureibacillus thermosphaericus TaxID=51173 RepID=A0A840PX39_URETH|nr:S4 domain-containing protein YaaA [Ureibacillus thermosphaericus]MBB5150453.1 ribosome-associated protein [Ureibacillus thermosphaericus]NKZ32031.1 S4 domain-containing protein YaaA [Ureibacillus thermosphaericus]
MNEIVIDTEFITLGQVLKVTNAISSGGMAKWFLEETDVYVNGEIEKRRGKKLRNGDVVNIPGIGRYVIVNKNGEKE